MYIYVRTYFVFIFPFKIFFIPLSLSLPTLFLGWNACFVFVLKLFFFFFFEGGREQEEDEVAEVTVKHSRPKYRIEKTKKKLYPPPCA